jgi:hypothetical protein
MLSDVKVESLSPEIYEAMWIGDPAVDRESTDIPHWIETGEGCVVRPRETPSIIKWRGLNARELRNVSATSYGQYLVNKPAELARYGIVSIKGEGLRYDRYGGVRGLSDETIDRLDNYVETLPSHILYRKFYKLMGYDVELPEREEPVSLLDWVGCLIASKTFR